MSDEFYVPYARELTANLKELALDARKIYDEQRGQPGEEFAKGYLMGLHRTMREVESLRVAYDLPRKELGLLGLEVDKDLLPPRDQGSVRE